MIYTVVFVNRLE